MSSTSVPLSQYFKGSHNVLYFIFIYFINTNNILEKYLKNKITVCVQKILVPSGRHKREEYLNIPNHLTMIAYGNVYTKRQLT